MRRHFCIVLLCAFVLVSAFEEAHSSSMDSNGAPNKTQPVAIVDDPHPAQEPTTGEIARLDSGVEGETTEETTETQTTMFNVENEGRSIAGTGEGTLLETSSSEPGLAGNVRETDNGPPVEEVQRNQETINIGNSSASEANTSGEQSYPRRDTDQMPTASYSPNPVGFREMFTFLSGSDSQVNNPVPADVNNQTRRTASIYLVPRDSDEGSDSLEDDISYEMLPPVPVLLAQVKQFVQAKTRAGHSPVRSSLIQQDHPIVTGGSAVHRHAIVDSDEDDHSNEQDLSLEVDINLLPEIRRYLKPKINNRGAAGHRQTLLSQDYEDPGTSLLETKSILENPAFQQMIRKIDSRLKRASGARAKRLMEKYVEALAVYPPLPFNTASTSVTFYRFLPFFITCFLASLS